MSENPTEGISEAQDDLLHPAPEDRPEDSATGFAVYNRTLGQFVPGVSTDKPGAAAVRKAVPEGHTAVAVRV